MKKLRHILAILLRTALILIPGIATAVWLYNAHGLAVSILAALGVEFLFCGLVTLVTVVAAQIKVQLDKRKGDSDE